jgi:hypothetical protein
LILVVCGAGEVIVLLFGEVAGGEEEVVVDLDRGELRKFLMKEVDGGDGGGADFDFVGGVCGEEVLSVDESGEFLVVRNEVESAKGFGDFVIGAAGEVLRVDGDVLEVAVGEEEVGGEELGELVEVDGMGGVGALVAERGESSDEEVKKLFVGGEVLDRTIEIVVKFCVEDVGGFTEGGGAFGEEGDFSEGVGGMEEVVEVGVGEGGEIK